MNPNDPAFSPTVCDPASIDPAYRDQAHTLVPSGLTKREYFAGLAMQGMMTLHPRDMLEMYDPKSADSVGQWVAKNSVAMADTLIAELSK